MIDLLIREVTSAGIFIFTHHAWSLYCCTFDSLCFRPMDTSKQLLKAISPENRKMGAPPMFGCCSFLSLEQSIILS